MTEKGEAPKLIINSKGEEKTLGPRVNKTNDRQAELDRQATIMGQSFAEAMGTPEPARDLETYRNAEEYGTPFSISPGSEPRFMVLYQHDQEEWLRERKIWEIRSIFVQARAQKGLAGSVDSVANPVDSDQARRLDPLGVEFKKERLELLYREMPGLLAAKAIYATIIGGKDFVGYTPEERKYNKSVHLSEDAKLRSVKEPLLVFPEDKLKKIYSENEIKELKKEYHDLYFGTDNGPACPGSVYGAKEPGFYTLRKSIRFFLKTSGSHLLFVNDKDKEKVLRPGDDYQGMVEKRTEGNTVLERMSTRAREAEQAAWNFIFTTGLIESFNIPESNQYIREHKNKPLGPSNFMTLYLWMMIHPQIRFEGKVLGGSFDGGEDDAKENWSSLGSWAANNIQSGAWRRQVLDARTMQPERNPDGTVKYKTVIPTFIRPDLVYDALREESNVREAFFDFFTQKGTELLNNPDTSTHRSLYDQMTKRKSWEKLPESPMVNYRFDRLRWARAVYIVFKKGKESTRDVSLADLAEAKRKLGLSQQEVMNLLLMRTGVNVHSPSLKPAEGALSWGYYLRTMKRNQPDLFRDDSGKRERL